MKTVTIIQNYSDLLRALKGVKNIHLHSSFISKNSIDLVYWLYWVASLFGLIKDDIRRD